jgi:ADP-heptose:LPS heptosyltransferase
MRLLVIRTSAMGDVALTVPVLKGMREQYPEVELVLVTRSSFKPFFSSVEGLSLFHTDLKSRHKGFSGIVRLYSDLRKGPEIDYVIDLHNVLRSRILGLLFRMRGIPVAVIDKGRREKRLLITGKGKKQLRHSVMRYCDVFAKAGFPVVLLKDNLIVPSGEIKLNASLASEMEGVINIGVAPYARHPLKMWPEEYMIRLLNYISENQKVRFWLFGGPEDTENLKSMTARVPRSVNLAGVLNLEEELFFMSRLNLMIAMDSSNMHMAALVGTKVISIWGGTDPLNGFSAWMQPDSFSIRIPVDELTCRPCTIYGKGKTKNGFACMKRLTPELVFDRIEKLVLSKL